MERLIYVFFFFSSRRRHTRFSRDWSSDVCSSDLDELRTRERLGLEQVVKAVDLTLALSEDRVTVVVDHAGLMLAGLADADARDLLGAVRALRQQHPRLDLVLVEHPGGA